jgi:Rap1a immunity proteins
MRPILLGVLAAALLAEGVEAQQRDMKSANFLFAACQKLAAGTDNSTDNFLQGVCGGIVDTLADMKSLLPSHYKFCPPKNVTTEQAVRVVVAYIERRPQRMHESFKLFALEALHEAWPCR